MSDKSNDDKVKSNTPDETGEEQQGSVTDAKQYTGVDSTPATPDMLVDEEKKRQTGELATEEDTSDDTNSEQTRQEEPAEPAEPDVDQNSTNEQIDQAKPERVARSSDSATEDKATTVQPDIQVSGEEQGQQEPIAVELSEREVTVETETQVESEESVLQEGSEEEGEIEPENSLESEIAVEMNQLILEKRQKL